MKQFIAMIAVAAAVISGCGSSGSKVSGQVGIQTVPVDSFEQKLSKTPSRLLLDVRTPGEFEGGHIKGAVNMNVQGGDFEASASKLDTNLPVFVYCLAGGRSAHAAEILQGMGFKTIYNLDGGMGAWNGAGKPVERGAAAPVSKGMTKQDYDALVFHHDTITLIDIGADWCAPCKQIRAYLPELEKEFAGKLKIVQIDYDKNKDLMTEIKVSAVPTLIILKNGIEKWNHPKFATKEEVIAAIKAVK